MAGDNEGVKEDFLDSLKDLTFPARPVIQNLTSIAHENVLAAKVIVEAIEIHITKVIRRISRKRWRVADLEPRHLLNTNWRPFTC